MKLTVVSTETKVVLDGIECRIWKGTHENGGEVELCVHRLRTDDPLVDLSEFGYCDPPAKVEGGPSQLDLIIDYLTDERARTEVLNQSVDASAPPEFKAGIDTGLWIAAMLLRVGRQVDGKSSQEQINAAFLDNFKGLAQRLGKI